MSRTAPGFTAKLFQPDIGNEGLDGFVVVHAQVLQFQSEAMAVDIPLANLQVDFEDGGKGFFLSDARAPEVTIYSRASSILRHPTIRARRDVANYLSRREFTRALRLTGYFALGCVLVTWLGSMAMSLVVSVITARIPMEWERKLGAGQMESLEKRGALLDDTNAVAQLTALAEPLVKALPPERRDLKFYIASNSEPNAFALPGGSVVVTSGLLEMLDQPDEVLGVMAHELAHQTKRHAMRRGLAAAGPLVIFGLFLHSNSGMGTILAVGSGLMVFQGFSQEYETEADDVGWNYLVAAKIDPGGMIRALKKLDEWERKRGLGGFTPSALRSHPDTAKRIARLEKKFTKLPPKAEYLHLEPVHLTVNTNISKSVF